MIHVHETDERFYIAPSALPDAGLGCFAKVLIPKGDFLEIMGVAVEYGSEVDKCTRYAARYKFAAEPIRSFKNVIVPMGYAGMVNQANYPEQQNVAIAHLPLDRETRNENAGQAVYLALRDIQPGEELLGNYNRKDAEKVKNEISN